MKNKFILGLILPILILLGMTARPLATQLWGTEISIQTSPVDPTDLFRGDYVTLRYPINDLPLRYFPELKGIVDYQVEQKYLNKEIFVSLKPVGKLHEVSQVSFTKPSSGVYLTGKIIGIYGPSLPEENGERTVAVDYSLDKYFVPENSGGTLEEKGRKGQLIARVKVWQGYAQLVGIE